MMLLPRIIACLDCRAGRVVKGVRFQGLRDAGDPVECAQRYAEQGADELVLLDVAATPDGQRTAARTVRAVRAALPIPLTVGGGVRTVDDAERLLAAGADKVAVNTAAVDRPELLAELQSRLGTQCTVLALDAARDGMRGDGSPSFAVVTRSGAERRSLDACSWARRAVALGAGEILLTSWDRDGTRSGYDLELIGALRRAVAVPIIASGGAAHAEHLAAALAAGADAVLVASLLHDGDTTLPALKAELAAAGIEVRR
ncbi:MAG: imidazole glycerol phosphate synthase subunit HisF [Planctomycetes bacterium]|nr:imidazole glycerol phosphate synthase subunit HisF [Planctomycetota bacterium]